MNEGTKNESLNHNKTLNKNVMSNNIINNNNNDIIISNNTTFNKSEQYQHQEKVKVQFPYKKKVSPFFFRCVSHGNHNL